VTSDVYGAQNAVQVLHFTTKNVRKLSTHHSPFCNWPSQRSI